MPVTPTYPGVYIEELSSGVRSISGVATSTTAFVGYTARGLDNRAKRIFSFGDFERHFGGLSAESELSYSVNHYFANGGSDAWIVRVPKNDAKAALITLEDNAANNGAKKSLTFTALSKGAWANQVLIDVDYDGIPPADTKAFNLTLTDRTTGTVESFPNVTIDSAKPTFVENVVNDPDSGSQLVSVKVADNTAGRPVQSGIVGGDIDLSTLKNDNDYGLKITLDVPQTAANTPVVDQLPVIVIAKGDAIPGSILGLAKVVERTISLALGAKLSGATVRVVPSASGKGLRILADAGPGRPMDSTITITVAANNDIAGTLKLDGGANPSKNVSHYNLGKGRASDAQIDAVAGEDGAALPKSADLIGSQAQFTGIYALLKVDLFNILCIPDATRALASNPKSLDSTVDPNAIYSAAMTLCQARRAFLLIDAPPNVNTVDSAVDWKSSGLKVHETNGAAYFPRLRMPDPLNDFQLRTFAPSGVIAGLLARTDASRGVWKAPAGVDARLTGVQGLVYELSDAENGALNPLGLNCIRTFPIYGTVCWGARTLTGADAEGSEWKYVPVRRLALFLEETLYRGSKWVVFEPNDESLWAQIRLNITAFMQSLFRQGAFAGASPREAYLVKCDKETTTQDDINRGIVNILVGFAPLKPAEFVIIKIQQLAGQVQA